MILLRIVLNKVHRFRPQENIILKNRIFNLKMMVNLHNYVLLLYHFLKTYTFLYSKVGKRIKADNVD
jgi:hypothetical protein